MRKVLASLVILVLLVASLTACQADGPAAEPGGNQADVAAGDDTAVDDTANDETGNGEAATDEAANDETADDTAPEADGFVAVEGGTLVIGEFIHDAQLAAINPFLPANTWAGGLGFMYEVLFFFNVISGELEPELGMSYSWDDDFMVLTVYMNTEASWHDGQPVTAEDVAFTYNVLREYEVLDRFGLWGFLSEVRAEGDTVVFELSTTFLSLPYYMSEIFIVPQHIWADSPDITLELNEEPIGSGPFMWASYTYGTSITFDANPNFWRGAPRVDTLIVNMYNTSPNVTLALIRGDIQATMGTIAVPQLPEFLAQPYANIRVMPGVSNFVVSFNLENPLLQDPIVRQAIVLAVDQETLISRAELNTVYPASAGWLSSIFGDIQHAEAAASSLVFDPNAAVELLEDNGYVRGDDGIFITPDGERLSFTYHNPAGAPAQQMAAGMVQQWLLNIGIEIIPRLATWPELTHLLQSGDFDLLQTGIAMPPDPFAALNSVFHSSMTAPTGEPTPGLNYFRYRNPVVDDLLDRAAVETDPDIRRELLLEVQEIVAYDALFIPQYNIGPRIPFYDGLEVSGWIDDASIMSRRGIIKVFEIQR